MNLRRIFRILFLIVLIFGVSRVIAQAIVSYNQLQIIYEGMPDEVYTGNSTIPVGKAEVKPLFFANLPHNVLQFFINDWSLILVIIAIIGFIMSFVIPKKIIIIAS